MKRNEKIKQKIILTILIGIGAIVLYLYVLNYGQNVAVMRQFQKEMSEDIKSLRENYPNAELRHGFLIYSMDNLYSQDIQLISEILKQSGESDLEDMDEKLKSINSFFGFTDIMIADAEGNIVSSAANVYEDLKDQKYDPLRNTFQSMNLESVRILTEEDVTLLYSDDYVDTAGNSVAAESGDTAESSVSNVKDVSLDTVIGKDKARRFSNLYAYPLDQDHQLVISVFAPIETMIEEQSDPWNVLLLNEIIGEQGYVFVWSETTKKILYFPPENVEEVVIGEETSYKYQNIETLGMDMSKIKDGEFSWNTINGQEMYIYPVYDTTQDVWIACAVSRDEMINSNRFVTIIQWVAFALFASVLLYYITLLLRQNKIMVLPDFTGSGKTHAHQSRQHKLFIITIVISAVLMLFAYYLQTLYLMSSWAASSSRQTNRIESVVSINEVYAESFISVYEAAKNSQIAAFCNLLSENEEIRTPGNLDMYSYFLEASDIQILGKDGTSQVGTTYMAFPALTYEMKTDESLNYAQAVARQDNDRKTCDWMADGRKALQSITDSEGIVNGYVYIHYYSASVDSVLDRFSLSGTLEMVHPGKGGFVFAVNAESHLFDYYPNPDMIGRDALENGLTESQIKDNYCDYITVNSETYYATTDLIDNDVIFYVISKANLLQQRLWFSVNAVATAFVLYLLIGIVLYTSRKQIEVTMPDGERRSEMDDSQSAEYRMMRVLKYYVAAAAAAFSIYSLFRGNLGSGTVLGYVLDGKWERGVNVFAFTNSVIIMCRGGIILFIVARLIGAVGSILPVRGGTILKMLASLCEYIVLAFLLYQCMLSFGLNPTALAASAGIFSVILGIGANSLVGDILAGIFILMEGNIQVGDVVQIGDFRGYVMELGIRMTKLFDMDTDDVKIIPNNEVRNVVHMTMRKAVVYSSFQIRYEEKLEDVERVLREELKKVTNKSPLILEGPVYIGVSELGDSGVVLKTLTKCHESCRKKVEREVNHIVYTIFQKNNINVPYPQVTLHQGDDEMVEREFPEDEGI